MDIEHNDLLKRVLEKQLIFTVTAGRTGTTYLQKLFSLFSQIHSVHEGEPNYVHVLRRIQTQPSAATRFLLEHKLPAIAAHPVDTYVETSHLFCKGFLEPLINLGITPDLVLLRRPPRKIAWSLFERNTIPERSTLGTDYLIAPSDPNTLPMPAWQGLSDYQLCFWYALEIERRQDRYTGYITRLGGNVFDVTADELNNPDKFFMMAKTFNLSTGDHSELIARHHKTSSIRHNKNTRKLHVSFDLDKAEERVWENISHYEPFLYSRIADRYLQANA